MAVFYKAVSVYLKVHPDQKIIDAFHRHFSAISIEDTSDEYRNITTIEGMLDIARLTGDEALRQKAFDAYARFDRKDPGRYPYDALTVEKMKHLKNIVFHGVSLCEEIKLPVLLYMAGGDPEYLQAAQGDGDARADSRAPLLRRIRVWPRPATGLRDMRHLGFALHPRILPHGGRKRGIRGPDGENRIQRPARRRAQGFLRFAISLRPQQG